jgi:ABC-type phosphonate transport system ATPase subunit
VEIGQDRLDDLPQTFSGGMLQRLQIARTLVNGPRLVFMECVRHSLTTEVLVAGSARELFFSSLLENSCAEYVPD